MAVADRVGEAHVVVELRRAEMRREQPHEIGDGHDGDELALAQAEGDKPRDAPGEPRGGAGEAL